MDIDGEEESEKHRLLKHDLKNQLSNIILAMSQLEFEMANITEDQQFYLKAVTDSCKRINDILDAI